MFHSLSTLETWWATLLQCCLYAQRYTTSTCCNDARCAVCSLRHWRRRNSCSLCFALWDPQQSFPLTRVGLFFVCNAPTPTYAQLGAPSTLSDDVKRTEYEQTGQRVSPDRITHNLYIRTAGQVVAGAAYNSYDGGRYIWESPSKGLIMDNVS